MTEAIADHDTIGAVSWGAGAVALLSLAGSGAFLEARRRREASRYTPPTYEPRTETDTGTYEYATVDYTTVYPDIPYNGSPHLGGEDYWGYPAVNAPRPPAIEPRVRRPACLKLHFAKNPEDFEPGEEPVCGATEFSSNKTVAATCPFAATVEVDSEAGAQELVLRELENTPRCADELGMLSQTWKYVD